jgi:RNA-binding protein YlmH
MDKNTFVEKIINISGVKNGDASVISNLYNKIVLAEKTGKTIYSSEFYTPNIWGALLKLDSHFDVSFGTDGIFDDAERRLVAIGSGDISNYPVRLVKITATSKFSSLSHSDFLGAIMSLGVKREKFGDLILQNDICFAAVHEELCDYLIFNLSKVKNSPCHVEVVDQYCEEKPAHVYEYLNVLSSSLRLDCVVSGICNISRNKSEELIRQGKILVDYFPVLKRDFLVSLNSLIVIRGYGKFILCETIGSTGSGRLKLQVKKFI